MKRCETCQAEHDAGGVELAAPFGRGVVRRSYCLKHGGLRWAQEEAERAWVMVAPESVGDAMHVQYAGSLLLCSEHKVISVRWFGVRVVVFLGTGTHLMPVGSFPLLEYPAALAAGRGALHNERERRIAEIRTLRGGTLDWGLPVVPRETLLVSDGERVWEDEGGPVDLTAQALPPGSQMPGNKRERRRMRWAS